MTGEALMKTVFWNKIIKNIITMTVICGVAVMVLYVVGRFIDLHPDAYQDLIKSILLGYGIYLGVYGLYKGVYQKLFPGKNVKLTVKRMKETPLESICVTFMVITLLNSIMMLTGMDIPKEGVFAYIHMMTRLLIITGIITIFMWKEVIKAIKNYKHQGLFRIFVQKAPGRTLQGIAKVFTVITTIYCIVMIALQNIIDSAGGAFFYQSLLGILLAITIGRIIFTSNQSIRKRIGG